MLSTYLIEKKFENRQFDALLGAVASHGWDLPVGLRVKLSRSAVPAVALGLRRVAEMTYGPTPLSRSMVRFLLEADVESGDDVLAMACLVSAFDKLLSDHPQIDEMVAQARDRALVALVAQQSQDPDHPGFADADDRGEDDRDLTTAFILALLADNPTFRGSVRFAEMLDRLDDHRATLGQAGDQLRVLAHVGAGHKPMAKARSHHRAPTQPMLAA
ncbi:MAG: hypothetical protein GC164_07365 [Phycisphaera sp.]|nr:hypothetical protein [Phycisphaera sp.]